MAETEEIVPDSPSQELRSVVLRIPGEHFFCETIDVPRNLDPGDLLPFALQSLVEEGISPYPPDQLSWGYFSSIEHGKLILFGGVVF